MKFPENTGKKAGLTQEINRLIDKPFDPKTFYEAAKKAGYAEARAHHAGQTLEYKLSRTDRLTASVAENGRVKRFHFG